MRSSFTEEHKRLVWRESKWGTSQMQPSPRSWVPRVQLLRRSLAELGSHSQQDGSGCFLEMVEGLPCHMASIRRTNKQTAFDSGIVWQSQQAWRQRPGPNWEHEKKRGFAADLSLNGGQATHRDSGLGSVLAREGPEPLLPEGRVGGS